jgi:hypothetical protein
MDTYIQYPTLSESEAEDMLDREEQEAESKYETNKSDNF